MKQYKVEITKSALQDMEDIYNYIAEELLVPEKIKENRVIVTDVLYSASDIEARLRGE